MIGRPAAAHDATAGEPAPFQPGDISIGEPLQLPLSPPQAVLSMPSASPARPAATAPDVAGDATARPQEPGNGWLGLAVDDSLVTGRLVIVDVAENGPASRAGIGRQDHLLAIDGEPLHTADQLAAALAAIAPGRNVKLSVGRGDRISDTVIRAEGRPALAISRDWQAAASVPPAAPARTASAFGQLPPPSDPADVQAAPSVAAPSVVVPPREPPAPFDSMTGRVDSMAARGSEPVSRTAPRHELAGNARGRTALGVRTRPVDQVSQARFRLAEPVGALVIGVVQDLPASKAGVPPGSVIVAIDDRPVRSPTELTQLVTNGPVGTPVTLEYVLPGGEERHAKVTLQSLEVPLERALAGDDAPSLAVPPSAMPPAVARRIVQRADGTAAVTGVRRAGADDNGSGVGGSSAGSPVPGPMQAGTPQAGTGPVQVELQRLRDRIDRLERRLERLR